MRQVIVLDISRKRSKSRWILRLYSSFENKTDAILRLKRFLHLRQNVQLTAIFHGWPWFAA